VIRLKKLIIFLTALLLCSCQAITPQPQTDISKLNLTIRSNRQVVVDEGAAAPPTIELVMPSYIVRWLDGQGNSGLFVGPYDNTNIIVKEGKPNVTEDDSDIFEK
jgi:hypothetical protein